MALFLRQDEERTDVQQRVATELQERLRSSAKTPGLDDHEPDMLKSHHETRAAGMIIMILIALLLGAVIWMAVTLS